MGTRRQGKKLEKVVLDASIIIKSVLPGEDDKNVLSIFKNFSAKETEIILPSLWVYEVGNVLQRALSMGDFEEKFKFLLSLPFENYNFNGSQNLTIGKFAKTYGVTFYDASYHMLAIFEDAAFITADKKYFGKCKAAGNIELL